MNYPKFEVSGVPQEDVWQLFNCSNYEYYKLKVKRLREGVCGFCRIDRRINTVIFQTRYWIVMENTIAPQGGQEHQFVIPSRRHVSSINELTSAEFADLFLAIKEVERRFHITGGVIVIRSGDPAKNARSMPHLHVNYHVPTGKKKVGITIAKSERNLKRKLKILQVFEKMRLIEEMGWKNPADRLTRNEKKLVKDKLGKRGSC